MRKGKEDKEQKKLLESCPERKSSAKYHREQPSREQSFAGHHCPNQFR
jgi:hypothetical protein